MSLPIRRLAILQRAVFLINSRLDLFTVAASLRHPFYRRYRAILPSSLERFNSRALEYSSRIPVSVCGTGNLQIIRMYFPGNTSGKSPSAVASRSACAKGTFFTPLAFRLPSTCASTLASRCGNINPLCIDYSLRPRLSSRLTLGGRTFPRKPYPYGGMDFNHTYRYSCLDYHFQKLHARSLSRFYVVGTLSYQLFLIPQIRCNALVPIIFGANSLDG